MASIQQFEVVEGLGHASFLVADESAGVAAVVDPARDVEPYLAAARELGVRIVTVLDTHAHSDYLSGVSALIASGAHAIAPIGSTVGYDSSAGWHGRRISLGALELELLHTPGHTPEHTAILVHGVGETGATLLSGGSLLVGDVGRPDLLGGPGGWDGAARAMVHSMLDIVLQLDADVEVLPTHVGGSLCAGAISAERSTTVGEQSHANPTLRAMTADAADVGAWLRPELLPSTPSFWSRARALNQGGVPLPVRGVEDAPRELGAAESSTLSGDVTILDLRDPEVFARLHLMQAINVPLQGSFPVWAAAVTPEAGDVVVVANDAAQALRAHRQLLAVRQEGVAAWLPAAELANMPAGDVGRGGIVDSADLLDLLQGDTCTLVDVRNPLERSARPLSGAVELSAVEVLRDPSLLPDGRLAIACASGYRAAVVASALRSGGRRDVLGVDGEAFGAVTAMAAARMAVAW